MSVKMRKKSINSNLVAKHARTFNKSDVFEDQKKALKKGKVKHKARMWPEKSIRIVCFFQSAAA